MNTSAPRPLWKQETARFRAELIKHYIAACGNRTLAAKALGINRTYLCRLIAKKGTPG